MSWISSNIALVTLIITGLLAVITLEYTLLTRRMLKLASQPTVVIRRKDVSIIPEISDKAAIGEDSDDLEKGRYCLSFSFELINIGNQPAQNIYFDAEAHFKTNRPLGKKVLPLHLPEFLPFLSPKSNANQEPAIVSAQFHNFVGKELIRDFFKGRRSLEGLAFLPSKAEMKNRALWPSPKILVHCFYSDIQGQHFVSEIELFFHIWRDKDHGKLGVYVLNMQELEFIGIRRVSRRFREAYIKKNRSNRYSSFSGDKYSKGELLLLQKASSSSNK